MGACWRIPAPVLPPKSWLADELCKLSPEFSALWRDNDVRRQCEGTKRLRHATHGIVELEYSGFAVDGRPDLSMIIYNPVTDADADCVRAIVEGHLAGRKTAPI